MCHKSKLAMICVSHTTQGLALFHDLCTHLPYLYLSGCWHQPGRGRHSFTGRNKWQKWTLDPYHRRFDAYHRLNLAVYNHFGQKSDHSLLSLKKATLWVNLDFGRFYEPEKSPLAHLFELNRQAILWVKTGEVMVIPTPTCLFNDLYQKAHKQLLAF